MHTILQSNFIVNLLHYFFNTSCNVLNSESFLSQDCCVSFYHHTENIAGYNFQGGSFDDYFELFINGQVDYEDYFDCVMSWYEHRNDPNVLFITYEELKKDTVKNVLKIAEFMGPQYKVNSYLKYKLLQKTPSKLNLVNYSQLNDLNFL